MLAAPRMDMLPVSWTTKGRRVGQVHLGSTRVALGYSQCRVHNCHAQSRLHCRNWKAYITRSVGDQRRSVKLRRIPLGWAQITPISPLLGKAVTTTPPPTTNPAGARLLISALQVKSTIQYDPGSLPITQAVLVSLGASSGATLHCNPFACSRFSLIRMPPAAPER